MATNTKDTFNHRKYQPYPPLKLTDRTWPDKVIDKAPIWCSVDLRDGNQALVEPMNVEQKSRLWDLLIEIGFKEIEIGFPAASQPDFDFTRMIIEENRIPEDVTIQALVQAREPLIERTYEALQGCKQAIVHVYNSTSTVQREHVFGMDREGVKNIAVQGAKWVKQYADKQAGTDWTFQYSPESFTGTEMDYAAEVCNAVIDVWQPTTDKKVIINLPSTVEMTTPNVYADQIEWMCRHLKDRENLIISLHTHNDRGTGIASSEFGLMAGADRVEGTLFGNGERTGNLDIVTMAMNMYSQGIDSGLNFANMDEIRRCAEYCTQIDTNPRHPYVGELVFTAFSGSHQDAIRKCLNDYHPDDPWDIAYLPIDPKDINRDYQAVIRINSQSGKGGVAYIMEQDFGFKMPRALQIDFSHVIQKYSEETEAEVPNDVIWKSFQNAYINSDKPLSLLAYTISQDVQKQADTISVRLQQEDGTEQTLNGTGSGPIEAFVSLLKSNYNLDFNLIDYHEHAIGAGSDAKAACYIQIKVEHHYYFGVGLDSDIMTASMTAVLRAINNAINAKSSIKQVEVKSA